MSLAAALRSATPGTVIQLLPGRFVEKVIAQGLQGREGAPIVIQGSGRATVIDGEVWPHKHPGDADGPWLANGDFRVERLSGRRRPFFSIERAAWLEFRNLFIKNCWPFAILARDSHHLTLAACEIRGSTCPLYIDDDPPRMASHHILVERNRWVQDPTGDLDRPPEGMRSWHEWTWQEMKDGARRFMNGALLGSDDLAGTVVFRDNQLSCCFNGLRLAVRPTDPRRPIREVVGEVPGHPACDALVHPQAPRADRNNNVEAYRNRFEYVRDNAIEPEHVARNWWVHGNVFTNVRKIFSLHNVGGGFWYFFGNVGATEALPPAQLRENPNEPTKLGGKIFKFYVGPPLPDRPCFAFHNSWRPRGAVLAGDGDCGGEARGFHHLNNAVEHCAPVDAGVDLRCGLTKFADDVDLNPLTGTLPQTQNQFDCDVSNASGFPDDARQQGHEAAGRAANGAVFDPARRADYVLAPGSAARGLARGIHLRPLEDWPAAEGWPVAGGASAAPDAGAIQPDGRYEGPPFAHLPNPLYEEAPRLVAIERHREGLGLVFSVQLGQLPPGLPPATVVVRSRAGDAWTSDAIAVSGRRLLLSFADPATLPGQDDMALTLPRSIRGAAGAPLSAWAAIVPIELADPGIG
jgi:hypothetical protein